MRPSVRKPSRPTSSACFPSLPQCMLGYLPAWPWIHFCKIISLKHWSVVAPAWAVRCGGVVVLWPLIQQSKPERSVLRTRVPFFEFCGGVVMSVRHHVGSVGGLHVLYFSEFKCMRCVISGKQCCLWAFVILTRHTSHAHLYPSVVPKTRTISIFSIRDRLPCVCVVAGV